MITTSSDPTLTCICYFVELANSCYDTFRKVLLDKRYFETNANDGHKFDNFLSEKLLTQQYLKSSNPAIAKEFMDFAERIQNEVTTPIVL